MYRMHNDSVHVFPRAPVLCPGTVPVLAVPAPGRELQPHATLAKLGLSDLAKDTEQSRERGREKSYPGRHEERLWGPFIG